MMGEVMAADLKKLRHPIENSRFLVALIVVIPLALLVLAYAVITFGLVVLAVYLLFLFFRNLVYIQFIGNAVRVDENSFPEIHQAAQEICQIIGYKKDIDIFIYEEGSFNAMLVPFLKKKAVVLNSETVHGASTSEIRWLIGRFVGYLQGKKLRFMWFEFILNSLENTWVFNLFLYPYERAAVLTGDRIGAYAVDYNEEAIIMALNKLMVGPDIAHRVHTDGLYSQYQELKSKSFFSLLARLYIPFPHMIRRVAEMHIFLEETNFSQMPHPDKTLMGSAGAGTRPQARPAQAASDPYTVDPAFRREAPFQTGPAPEPVRPTQPDPPPQTARAANVPFSQTSNSGPGIARVLLGILCGLGVIIGGDILTYGFSEDFLPGTTTFWPEDLSDPAFRETAFMCIAYAIGGALIARLVGGRATAPLIMFGILFVWTLIYGIGIAPDNFGSLEGFAEPVAYGAGLFGGSALLCALIPRRNG